ncbi:class I SAM-dependent methyltransferase [Kitasatospora sp. NBC_00039]|uniref:class I SAM-dependent methyltransferase n=1 Tax=Kitasatospora sp. NBC_00039 TaxID=2903565 RepID=UPI0032536029
MTTDQLGPRPCSPPRPSGDGPGRPTGDRLLFLGEALRTFHGTGALAPSGPDLVNALVVPVTSRPDRPLSVLEVGAGTGVVTRRLAQVLRPGDRLHMVEANPRFADRLRADAELARRGPEVGLRLSACRVEELPEGRAEGRAEAWNQAGDGGGHAGAGTSATGTATATGTGGERYDVIVSGLPFTNFEPAQVQHILDLYLRLLVPGGELTYFGYLGTTAARTLVSGTRHGARHRAVVRLLRRFEAAYGLGSRTVWRNLPPARAHLLRAPVTGRVRQPAGTAPTGSTAGSTGGAVSGAR